MLISTKGRYAIRILVDIAENSKGGVISLSGVSERQEISSKYMEIIAHMLVDGGILVGFRGKKGGYKLAKAPEEISILEVLELTEGTVAPVHCLEKCDNECPKKATCRTVGMWTEVGTLISEYFGSKTIRDLMKV